jgi:hypothetical protein
LELNSKKLGRGFFGGEGFIMQKIEGDGLAFVHSGGTLAKKELRTGEVLKVDTGCIVGFTKDVDYDIEFIGGIKNSIFWRRSILRHPSRPWNCLHTIFTFSRLADRIIASAPREEVAVVKEAYSAG